MNILYFVRHGQTAWNDIGRFQGSTDVPLNLLGIEQAEKAALALKYIHFDAIYSSPLNRAQVTAQTIARPHQLTVQVEPRIAEINANITRIEALKDGRNIVRTLNSTAHLSR